MPIWLVVHNKPLINASSSFTVTNQRPQSLSPCWCEQSATPRPSSSSQIRPGKSQRGRPAGEPLLMAEPPFQGESPFNCGQRTSLMVTGTRSAEALTLGFFLSVQRSCLPVTDAAGQRCVWRRLTHVPLPWPGGTWAALGAGGEKGRCLGRSGCPRGAAAGLAPAGAQRSRPSPSCL